MDVALKLLLLAALTLLVSAQTPTDYRHLSITLQKHIDKALEEGNRRFGKDHHVDFHSFLKAPMTMQSSLNVNVLLKVTTCKKTDKNAYKHRHECDTQKEKTPWIDCLVCKTTSKTELVHCAIWREVLHGKHQEIRKTCDVNHIGKSSIMAQKMPNDNTKQAGCLGCI
ncbi:cystatin-like protein [Clarias gariepinus]|uniref:cystatin-like protein n=1 Tax=Clarias gariepinus TaxID=13013 RepID=UPI00234DD945|nr:cystatin-like protein [Clarias gariepinus]